MSLIYYLSYLSFKILQYSIDFIFIIIQLHL